MSPNYLILLMGLERKFKIVNRLKSKKSMEPNILFIIIGAIALTSGLLLGKFVFAKNTSKLIQDAEDQAKKVIADGQLQAENLKKRNYWRQRRNLYS